MKINEENWLSVTLELLDELRMYYESEKDEDTEKQALMLDELVEYLNKTNN